MVSNIFWAIAFPVFAAFILGFLTYGLGEVFTSPKKEPKPASKSTSA
jgi:hypothetical protein